MKHFCKRKAYKGEKVKKWLTPFKGEKGYKGEKAY